MADEPVCARCKVTSSLMWEKNKEGEVLCLECHSSTRHESPSSTVSSRAEPPSTSTVAHSNETPTTSQAEQPLSTVTLRRTRLRNTKGRYGKAPEKTKAGNPLPPSSPTPGNSLPPPPPAARKGGATSGPSGRRSLLKGKPNKGPAFSTNIVTSDTILHKGTKYEVGDIVSVLDEGGRVYYALLRGFLEDQYAEKYAVLTWLIPTAPNPMTFDPSLFVLGPEEDSPRDMECLDFVTHSPQSVSFLSEVSRDNDLARLWTSKRRRIVFTSS